MVKEGAKDDVIRIVNYGDPQRILRVIYERKRRSVRVSTGGGEVFTGEGGREGGGRVIYKV